MSAYFLDGWKAHLQRLHEGSQSGYLCHCARVLWRFVGCETSNIADADGAFIVVGAVSTLLVDGTALVDASVKVDKVVIADVLPSVVLHVVFAHTGHGGIQARHGAA